MTISKVYLSHLKAGRKTTFSKEVAQLVSSHTGRPPIHYINRKVKDVFAKAYPELTESPEKKIIIKKKRPAKK